MYKNKVIIGECPAQNIELRDTLDYTNALKLLTDKDQPRVIKAMVYDSNITE